DVVVTFEIDANGTVNRSAMARVTTQEQSMTITGGSALTEEDIERMVREAEEHAAEDKARREAAEERNSAEQLVFSTEKVLKDNEDKLTDDIKSEVEGPLNELKTLLENEEASLEEIKS